MRKAAIAFISVVVLLLSGFVWNAEAYCPYPRCVIRPPSGDCGRFAYVSKVYHQVHARCHMVRAPAANSMVSGIVLARRSSEVRQSLAIC